MKVLVDSSVWIEYLRGTGDSSALDWLIEEGSIVTNELILAELTPRLLVRGESKLVDILWNIERVRLTLDWDAIIHLQVTCIRNGINKVGIPDLIIAHHAIQNNLSLLTSDKHFTLIAKHAPLLLHH